MSKISFSLSIMLAFCALFMQCKTAVTPVPYERNGQVEFVSGDKNTVTLTSRAFAETKSRASYYAERNAIANLLFRGIPGSNQENPMMATDTRSAALDQLVQKDYYKYVVSSVTTESNGSARGTSVQQEIKIDVNSLRKYLEDNKLARKFGM